MNSGIAILIVFGCIFVHLVTSQTFAQQCLNAHNRYRARHGVPRLTLDGNLNRLAQQWANRLARTGSVQRRPNNRYGENIYLTTTNPTGESSVTYWYNEIRAYDFNRPGSSRLTDHFSQVVWRDTKRVGCAIGRGRTANVVVCNYDPRGNRAGQYARNVPRPR